MQKRERNLLIGLGAAVAIALLLPSEMSNLLPFSGKRAALRDLNDTLSGKRDRETALLQAKGQLRAWGNESLPPDVFDAQRVYQEWLVDLARLAGFSNIEPKLGALSGSGGGTTYVPVPVMLNAEATLDQLARFLFHFERTRLLHRITRIDVTSPSTLGDVPFKIMLTAEGLSLLAAPDRARLFPRTTLTTALNADGTMLQVVAIEGFPTQGRFLVRLDRELLWVTAQQGTSWTVERGAEETTRGTHETGAIVELQPRKSPRDTAALASLEDYRRFVEAGPFSKPRPPIVYSPQLANISDQTLMRGTPLRVQARVSGWNPAEGTPQFELGFEAPEDMQVDADGWITWNPTASTTAGTYPTSITVTSPVNPDRSLSASFLVELKDVNQPPKLTLPNGVPQIFIGREWTFTATAEDPERTPLKYSLAGDVPTGLRIDPATGVLNWTPPLTVEPRDYPIQIRVDDAGTPPQSATGTVTVRVQDDVAQFTYLVGCLGRADDWTAWLYDRSTNTNYHLKVGSEFSIADIQGKVVEIDLHSMTYEDAVGLWKFTPEVSLRQSRTAPLAPVAKPDAATVEK